MQPHKYNEVMPCAAHRNRSLLLIATSWVCASSLQDEQLWLHCALKANIRSKLDQNYTRFPTLRFLLMQELKLVTVTLSSATHI